VEQALIGPARGIRVGAWTLGEVNLRSTTRFGERPTGISSFVGFRIAAIPGHGAVAVLTLRVTPRRRRAVVS
jgi:hypothetical protein